MKRSPPTATSSACCWRSRLAASPSCRAARSSAIARRTIANRSGFGTASRSRRSPGSTGAAYRPASSSSATRTTTAQSRRHRSSRRNSTLRRSCRCSRTRTTPRARCGIWVRTGPSSSTGSCNRTSPASGDSCSRRRSGYAARPIPPIWCGSRPDSWGAGRAARRSPSRRTPTIRATRTATTFCTATIRTGSPARSVRTCAAPTRAT